jgi:4-amino-4-deoxy-L-arabinose transferase-like glycosyltransferase
MRDRLGAPLVAGAVTAVLFAFASGYGYHRDELYFIAAGRHLDWAYADQGPFVPLLARAMTEIAPSSLTVLRLPSALAAGATVLLTALLARELGGGRRAELIAASCAAVSTIVLFTGHLLETSTFDLLAWTAVTWLAVRALRTGDDRIWLAAGVVLGLGLLNKPLPAFLAVGLLAGVVIAGPRRLLWNRYVWGGAAIALLLWSPWLVWQGDNGWPQIDVSRSIAEGNSASSEPWWAILPFQLLLVSPVLAPVWIAGVVRVFQDPAVREFRFLAWAWVVLAVIFMATGGKPYYLAGLLPVLIGAGAPQVDRWLGAGRRRLRAGLLAAAVATSAVIGGTIALPVLPADSAESVVAVNEDVGETIGWPELAETVARVYRRLPDREHASILTSNYGEAGAIDRYGPALGLPHAHSGHNAYGDWGPPPGVVGPVIAVGFDRSAASETLTGCEGAGRIRNDAGIDNDENGADLLLCDGPRGAWADRWPALQHLG